MAAANLKSTSSFGESQPENDKKYGNDLLIARFNNLTEAHHAQQALMGFGYPEDVVTVVELSHIAPKVRYAQDASQPAINRVLKVGAILVGTIFITLASLFVKSIFSLVEIGMMILIWITLTAGGLMICFFIGAMIWKLINSKAADWGLEAVKRGKMLINVKLRPQIEQMLKETRRRRGKIWVSVKLRAPGDARKIERRWREMAPTRPDVWIIQARD
jgi:hypothetical protein